MAHAANAVSSSVKDGTVRDLITAKFIKMLKYNHVVLSFLKIDDKLICLSDGSFAKLKCGGSYGGLFVILEGRDKKYMLLASQSQKLEWVIKNTLMAATLLSLNDAVSSSKTSTEKKI